MTRRLALAVMPLALAGLMLPGRPAGPSGPAQPGCIVPIPVLCPSPSPTPSPTASGSPSPTGSAPGGLAPSAGATPSGSAPPSPAAGQGQPGRGKKASSVKAPAAAGLMVSSLQFSLVTGSARLLGASYQGVVQVPTAGGRTVPMMEFTMNSLTLDGAPTLTVVEGRGSAVTSASSMHFTGNVVLYATALSGDLLGVPVTLTPSSPLAAVLRLLNSVTPLIPLKLTNVSTQQPYISAGSLQIPGLRINAAG